MFIFNRLQNKNAVLSNNRQIRLCLYSIGYKIETPYYQITIKLIQSITKQKLRMPANNLINGNFLLF
jgi:hypothetical protein